MKHPTLQVDTLSSVLLEKQPGLKWGTADDGQLALVFSGITGQHYINSLIERLEEARDALGR
jgi:hypothetical protein